MEKAAWAQRMIVFVSKLSWINQVYFASNCFQSDSNSRWWNKNKWVIYIWITSVEQGLYSLSELNKITTALLPCICIGHVLLRVLQPLVMMSSMVSIDPSNIVIMTNFWHHLYQTSYRMWYPFFWINRGGIQRARSDLYDLPLSVCPYMCTSCNNVY